MGKGGLIGLVALCGCASPAADSPAPRAVERANVAVQPVGSRVPQDPTADLCRAGELQWLVGKSRTEIPVPVDVLNRRVTCTTCPVTEDLVPHRLNIFYNEQTNVVEQVRCG